MVESDTSGTRGHATTEIEPPRHGTPDHSLEITEHPGSDVPGVLIFDCDGRVVSMTPNVDGYLHDLGALDSRWRDGQDLPLPVQVVLGALNQEDSIVPDQQRRLPRLHIQTHSGRWLLLHAAWTAETADRPGERIVVVAPAPEDAAWFVAVAYGLGSWKEELGRLLARGISTMKSARFRTWLVPVRSDSYRSFGAAGKAGTVAPCPRST